MYDPMAFSVRVFRWSVGFLSLVLLLPSCQQKESSDKGGASAEALFELLPPERTGIDFVNELHDDPTGVRNVLSYAHYYNGAGVAVGDINNDGLPDVFFAGNEVPNRLYLNKGDLRFEDISEKAGINQNKKWSSGVTMADVNGDGWLDIYVCQTGPYIDQPHNRRNLLFINNGDLTFSEKAAEYGLDDGNESTQAAFFDYDRDGDLDCYVMNESKYAQVILADVFKDLEKKENLEAASGNLYRNDGGKFTKVTEEAGLLRYGYGLGLVISDINQDGWPDIYVANDYSVPDFMFINNGDGTFTDRIKEYTRQVAFYGMGADIADYNNDGLLDIAVVDMAIDDHFRSKVLMASMDTEGFWYYVNVRGYQYQYMFNTLQLNNGNNTFSNIAHLAGVASSDWSWAALLADFDNDGWKDYFISNGFRRYARDNDFRLEMRRIREQYGGTVPLHLREEMYKKMPEIKLPNIMYRNNRDLTFSRVEEEWGLTHPSYSYGTAYADLDNDGDLDLLINNIDHEAFVYQNRATDITDHHFLRVRLEGETPATPINNTKVWIRYGDQQQFLEYSKVRGYASAMEDALHFGLGDVTQVDELQVVWPDGRMQILRDVAADQVLTLRQKDANLLWQVKQVVQRAPIEEIDPADIGLDFVHQENDYNDFAVQILLPHKQSTLGPKMAVGDLNGDGLEDLFIGGAANQAGQLFFQNPDGTFRRAKEQPWAELDALSEDMGILLFDADNDQDLDIYVVSGGVEFGENHPALQDRLYINFGQEVFRKVRIPEMLANGNVARAADFDQDGDLDVFVGGGAVPGKYPYPSRSYLLRNDNKKFTEVTEQIAPDLLHPGLVKDAHWADLNGDSYPDLILTGEWMPIRILLNEQGQGFRDASKEWGTEDLKGWWYSLAVADLDQDGDLDLVGGNLGLNAKFHASKKKPFMVFADDYDQNGSCDVVLSKEYKGKLVPTRGRECSSQQMPFIKEKFPTYRAFANASLEEIVGKQNLKKALHLEVTTFESAVLLNEGGRFVAHPLPIEAQFSPINGIVAADLNRDGKVDLAIAGNMYGAEVETPRYDAGNGLILLGDGKGGFEPLSIAESGFFAPGNVKDLKQLTFSKDRHSLLLVANNDGPLQVFRVGQPEGLSMR